MIRNELFGYCEGIERVKISVFCKDSLYYLGTYVPLPDGIS